ncbi:MAG: autotransporter domain-containing protein, partial [Proteobacteria bacterium]
AWGFWAQPLGLAGTIDAGGETAELYAGGLSAGVEGAIAPDLYAKVFGAVSTSSLSGQGNSASDLGFHAGAQLIYESPTWFADGTLGASLFSGTVTRTSAPGMTGTVLAGGTLGASETTDFAQWAAVRFGYHIEAGDAGTVSPYVFGRLANQNLAGFSEAGSVVAISGDAATVLSGEIGLGVKWTGPAFVTGPLDITPILDVAYSRQAGDYQRNFDLLGNGATATAGAIGPDTLQLGVAAQISSSESPFDLKLGYSAQIQSGATTHAVSLKLMGKF